MKFEDLTPYDLGLITSNCIQAMVAFLNPNRYEVIAEGMMYCIKAKGFNIEGASGNLIEKFSYKFDASNYQRLNDNMPSKEVMSYFFEFLKEEKVEIVKDDTRESTWSRQDYGIKET